MSLPPVLYVPPARYTDRTSIFVPVVVHILRIGAVMGLEWTTLKFIEDAPVLVRAATFVIALLILAVIESRDWLNFRRPGSFRFSIVALLLIYAGICGYAYAYLENHTPPESPAITSLQSELATSRRDRDFAILQRDAALREAHPSGPPSAPVKPAPPPNKASDIEARIDAWKSIDGLMNDFTRILSEGDDIIAKWKANQSGLTGLTATFRQHLNIVRSRLSQLIESNSDFSDLKIIDQRVPASVSTVLENLLQATSQLPQNTSPADYETDIGPYIGPLTRTLGPTKQWVKSVKDLAKSSVSDLESREKSK